MTLTFQFVSSSGTGLMIAENLSDGSFNQDCSRVWNTKIMITISVKTKIGNTEITRTYKCTEFTNCDFEIAEKADLRSRLQHLGPGICRSECIFYNLRFRTIWRLRDRFINSVNIWTIVMFLFFSTRFSCQVQSICCGRCFTNGRRSKNVLPLPRLTDHAHLWPVDHVDGV